MSENKIEMVDGQIVQKEFKPVNREFAIKQSAHAIHVLSTSLYSRPIEAIVRELSCNALDAHTAAGTTNIPFEVGMDHNKEGYTDFFVRDYGTGMDPADLERLYTTYFDSTKQQGDGFIGSFGLGSKSPFAYTKNFFITDTYFGMVHKYEAKVDEDTHIPSLVKLSEEFTGELANGIEIRFAIYDGKADEFRNAITKVLRWFGSSVVLVGDNVVQHWNDVVVLDDGKRFQLNTPEMRLDLQDVMLSKDGNKYDNSHVLLNKIMYRLEKGRFSGKVPKVLENTPFILKLDMDSVDVTPSREELHYSKRTLAVIEAKLAKAGEQVTAHIQEILKDYTDLELFKSYHDLYSQFAGFLPERYTERPGLTFRASNRYGCTEHKIWSNQRKWGKGGYKTIVKDIDVDSIIYTDELFNTLHVIQDNETDRPKLRMQYLLEDKSEDYQVRLFQSRAQFDEYLTSIHVPETEFRNVKMLSDLPKPPRKARAKRGSIKMHKVFQLGGTIEYGNTWAGAEIDIDEVEDAVYMPLMHWQVMLNGEKRHANALVSALKAFTKGDYTFYGVKTADVEELSKLDNWKSIEEVIEEVAQEAADAIEGVPAYAGSGSRPVNNLMSLKLEEVDHPLLTSIDAYQAITKAYRANKVASSKLRSFEGIQHYLPRGHVLRDKELKYSEWDSLLEPFNEQFPMLGMLLDEKSYWSERERTEHQNLVLQYLREQVLLYGANGERRN